MVKRVENYLKPSSLAKVYVSKSGEIGVSKTYINFLIRSELANVGSTDIDVYIIDGIRFAKQRKSSRTEN